MKNEELDRLFKQKSELFRAEPSSQAWQQLEAQLQQKKGRKIWLYVSGLAATFLLFAGVWLGINFYQARQSPAAMGIKQEYINEEVISMEPGKSFPEEAGLKQSGSAPLTEEVQMEEKEAGKENVASPATKINQRSIADRKIIKTNKASQPAQPTESLLLPQIKTKTMEPLIAAVENAETKVPAVPAPALTESIIIRYSAKDEQNHMLATIQEDILAIPREEKELSVRSVIGFLKNVKENSSGSLADLREAKNNLLSLRLGQQN